MGTSGRGTRSTPRDGSTGNVAACPSSGRPSFAPPRTTPQRACPVRGAPPRTRGSGHRGDRRLMLEPRPVQPVSAIQPERCTPPPMPAAHSRRTCAEQNASQAPPSPWPACRRCTGRHQDRARGGVAEQPGRRRCAARGIDMEVDRVPADPDPQPGASSTRRPRAPCASRRERLNSGARRRAPSSVPAEIASPAGQSR